MTYGTKGTMIEQRNIEMIQPLLRKLSIMAFVGLTLVSLCGCGPLQSDAPKHKVDEAKKEVERIAEAAHRFHADEGRFPDKLDELAPKYLPEIPKPIVGDDRSWGYHNRGEWFVLAFEKSKYLPLYMYDSRHNGRWYVDDK